MKPIRFIPVSFGILISSMTTVSQSSGPMSFNIGNDTYFLHQVAYHDMNSSKPSLSLWNQNMISDNEYIYLADHSDNSSTHLTIKRFNASDGSPASDIVVSEEDMTYYYIDELTDDERCFYLCKCPDNEHFILFFNTPSAGIKPSTGFYFYLMDKTGKINKEFKAKNVPGSWTTIGDFGIPQVIGDPAEGDFELLVPMVEWSGATMVVNYTFVKDKQSSCTAVFSCPNGLHAFSKPSIHILDNDYMVLDDNDILPSLYTYRENPNVCYATLDNHHLQGHGFKTVSYSNHRLVITGDVICPDGNLNNGKTAFNIGVWDNDIAPISVRQRSASAMDFSDYTPVSTVEFGKSNIPSGVSSTYRQFVDTSNFGNNISHLHFYVPGEFLSTYQLSKNDLITDVNKITCISTDNDLKYALNDKIISFEQPAERPKVFNTVGGLIYSSNTEVQSIDMSKYTPGIYIIHASNKAIKIKL